MVTPSVLPDISTKRVEISKRLDHRSLAAVEEQSYGSWLGKPLSPAVLPPRGGDVRQNRGGATR
ncbi:hypothetical protein GA0061105_10138 [Rhizobium aethiopicum]|uniref:Uncharacterized protein n=1 Tax=Rhizobium aethiopicum TaxID=1138170 RepID=A0A1C3XVD7_9HYPH|nr:hypothetical protein GA0061105_10138 [Rhizobium aethiopicum]